MNYLNLSSDLDEFAPNFFDPYYNVIGNGYGGSQSESKTKDEFDFEYGTGSGYAYGSFGEGFGSGYNDSNYDRSPKIDHNITTSKFGTGAPNSITLKS
jgi:hypothetical protein